MSVTKAIETDSTGHYADAGLVDESTLVADRWRGTDTDRHDMTVLGKKQVLRRNFNFVTMLGFSSTVICTWEFMLAVLNFGLIDGGTALLFWGTIISTIGMTFVYASLAEMASIAPTAGGQYHWVSEFAPPRIQKPLSYAVGWMCAAGWQVFLASVVFVTGTIVQGLIVLNYENYTYQNWHGTLLIIAALACTIIFNTALAVHLPFIEVIVLFIHITAFLATIITVWVMAPHGDPVNILLTFKNNGGWPSTGLAALIGIQTPISSMMGYDSPVHMSEETKDASATMPKAIMWSLALNSFMGFLTAVTFSFCLGPDPAAVLASPTGYPFLQIIYNSTGSLAATNTLTALIIICFAFCGVSEVATSSRQVWSFARDRGLPFSTFLARVNPGWNIPLRAVLVSLTISTLLSLINIGSSVALNAINSLGAVSVISSYYITIACLLAKRLRGEPLPPRRWSLGRGGLAVNVCALVFLTPVWFFYFWPLATPVVPSTMNWSSLMYGVVVIFAAVYYAVWGRHVYTAPVALTKRDL